MTSVVTSGDFSEAEGCHILTLVLVHQRRGEAQVGLMKVASANLLISPLAKHVREITLLMQMWIYSEDEGKTFTKNDCTGVLGRRLT